MGPLSSQLNESYFLVPSELFCPLDPEIYIENAPMAQWIAAIPTLATKVRILSRHQDFAFFLKQSLLQTPLYPVTSFVLYLSLIR